MANISDFAPRLLRRLGDALFNADEQLARNQGWEVEKGRLRLSRTFRHSGFDRLARCPRCLGLGRDGDACCLPCAGTGRITLGEAAPVRGR
jgi:hypothetical protein